MDSGGKMNRTDRYASILEERIGRQLHFINMLTMNRCDTYLAVRFLHIMQNELVVLRRQGRLFPMDREPRELQARRRDASCSHNDGQNGEQQRVRQPGGLLLRPARIRNVRQSGRQRPKSGRLAPRVPVSVVQGCNSRLAGRETGLKKITIVATVKHD